MIPFSGHLLPCLFILKYRKHCEGYKSVNFPDDIQADRHLSRNLCQPPAEIDLCPSRPRNLLQGSLLHDFPLGWSGADSLCYVFSQLFSSLGAVVQQILQTWWVLTSNPLPDGSSFPPWTHILVQSSWSLSSIHWHSPTVSLFKLSMYQ